MFPKGSKDNKKDASDGEDCFGAHPGFVVHASGLGHARDHGTSYRMAAIFPIACILFVILEPFVEETRP